MLSLITGEMTPNEIEPEKLEERLKEVAAGAVDAEKTARKKAKKGILVRDIEHRMAVD